MKISRHEDRQHSQCSAVYADYCRILNIDTLGGRPKLRGKRPFSLNIVHEPGVENHGIRYTISCNSGMVNAGRAGGAPLRQTDCIIVSKSPELRLNA